MNIAVVVPVSPSVRLAPPPTLTIIAPIQAKGKMFATIIADALAKTEVIAGVLPFGSKPTLVLFNYRCKHSSISPQFVDKAELEVGSLRHSSLVTTPTVLVSIVGFCA